MMSSLLPKMDLILINNTWHLKLMPEQGLILFPLGSSSSMPGKPKINSLVDQSQRLVLNLAHGRWRWSITIFKETGTMLSATRILQSTDCQDI
uniref:Non-structural protein NS-S n=1 Tax=Nyando virus TaxID=35316 RepID=A0A088MSP6_9VIRU|nr:nonstructural protein NSs [Nyando virus]